jgi:hypothetical protein
MAKRSDDVNKSQAIREFLEQNPNAKAKEVVAYLGQRNIDIKPSLVYMLKGRLAQMKSHKKQKAARVAQAGQKTGSLDPVALVVKVKTLAKEAGGMHNLLNLVSVLAD